MALAPLFFLVLVEAEMPQEGSGRCQGPAGELLRAAAWLPVDLPE